MDRRKVTVIATTMWPKLLDHYKTPIDELQFGLKLLNDEPKFKERYNNYVSPMVYAENPVHWDDAFAVVTNLANEVLDYARQKS